MSLFNMLSPFYTTYTSYISFHIRNKRRELEENISGKGIVYILTILPTMIVILIIIDVLYMIVVVIFYPLLIILSIIPYFRNQIKHMKF